MKTENIPFISTPQKSLQTYATSQKITPFIDEFSVESTAARLSSSAMSKFSPTDMTNRNETRREAPNSKNPRNGCFR